MYAKKKFIKELSNLRIAVTGSKGFIGRRLLESLQRVNIPTLPIEGDVRHNSTWKGYFDILYHLASALPWKFIESPLDSFSINIYGTLQALEACRQRNARMVYMSSSGVYKPKEGGSVSERDILEPKTLYGRSKQLGEVLCRTYSEHFGVRCTIFRLFNVYGAGQRSEFLIPYLVKSGLTEATARIKHPDSSRDFIHVKDVVDILLRVPLSDSLYSVFNVGSGRCYKVREIIDRIEEVLRKPILYQIDTSALDPYPFMCADIRLAKDNLGWSPQVSIDEGINEVIQSLTKDVEKKLVRQADML